VVKQHRRYRLLKVEHRHLWGLAAEYVTRLKAAGLSGNINTSFIERINLTIRRCVSKLARRTWGPAQFSSELAEHLYWWLAYYHSVREHENLRENWRPQSNAKVGNAQGNIEKHLLPLPPV
jgi:hypothetical protein